MGKLLLQLFHFAVDAIRESLGDPVRFRRFLKDYPEALVALPDPPKVAKSDCLTQWNRWMRSDPIYYGKRKGMLMLWQPNGADYWSCREVYVSALEHLTVQDTVEAWACDIQDVETVQNSKAPLEDFATLDDMIQRRAPEMIDELSEAKLQKNLAHREIRILHNADTSDFFERCLWDGRVGLMNSGGSHHFAAARYIAARLGRPVPLQGKLYTYRLNDGAVAHLKAQFDMYALSDTPEHANAFHECMERYGAAVGMYPTPPDGPPSAGDDPAKVIFLPKGNRRSMRVSALFKEAGAFDVGQFLDLALARQENQRG